MPRDPITTKSTDSSSASLQITSPGLLLSSLKSLNLSWNEEGTSIHDILESVDHFVVVNTKVALSLLSYFKTLFVGLAEVWTQKPPSLSPAVWWFAKGTDNEMR